MDEGNFEDGYGFDGSSIRGWQPINASDMLIIPDPATAKMDPFTAVPTLAMICDIVDPVTRAPYTRDPRNIAKKAEAYLKSSGIGDTAYIGPEAEFFIFDDIRYESSGYRSFYEIDTVEGTWNTGRDEGPNLCAEPTLSMICDIADPLTREPYSRDPRNIAKKAEAYLKSTGIGDTAFMGPEAEFFIFDDIRYDSRSNGAFYEIDSIEGTWNTGRDEGSNLGYKPRPKEGYFPVPPTDKFQDLRTEMVLVLEKLGIEIEAQHHEVATAASARST